MGRRCDYQERAAAEGVLNKHTRRRTGSLNNSCGPDGIRHSRSVAPAAKGKENNRLYEK